MSGRALIGIEESSPFQEERDEAGMAAADFYPSPGEVRPAYMGSQSLSPIKGEGDTEEDLPKEFVYPKKKPR